MKTVWFWLTIESRLGNSLLARIFVMHLCTTLQHDIGLNSLIDGGFTFFGTSVIMVAFTPL